MTPEVIQGMKMKEGLEILTCTSSLPSSHVASVSLEITAMNLKTPAVTCDP